MNLETPANLGEFIGSLAVIISIAYLALQVRQNTLSLRTESYGRALDRLSTMQAQFSQNSELCRLLFRAANDVFAWAMYEVFGVYEFMYHAAENGGMAREFWDRWASSVA